MATHALRTTWPHIVVGRPGTRVSRVLHYLTGHYLLLPVGAALALVWANLAPVSYFTVAHALAFPVNEILMVLFFGLVAQEVLEETAPGGALHRWRRWVMPIIAAVSGVITAAVAYALYVDWKLQPMLHAGWPLIAGVDIAFAYFIVKAIFGRHPVVPFVLLVALASNVIGFVAVAPTFMSTGERTGGAAILMAAAIGAAVWLRRQHVKEFWPYIWLGGGLSWLALYLEGFHPALALLPIVPFMPRARRRLDQLFADEADERGATVRHFEHVWHYQAQAALFLFGLVNAGVVLRGYDDGTWAALTAMLVGRPLGIAVGVAAAVALGFQLPAHVRGRELAVAALAASTGVTFSLFFATALLPVGPLLAQLKLGALLSAAGVPLAVAAAWLLRVGRFAPGANLAAHGKHRAG